MYISNSNNTYNYNSHQQNYKLYTLGGGGGSVVSLVSKKCSWINFASPCAAVGSKM